MTGSPNSRAENSALVILGGGSGHRAQSLAAACLAQFGHPPQTVTWREFLNDPGTLHRALGDAGWLRFETPDQDAGELAALYRAGASEAAQQGFHTLPSDCEDLLASGAIGSPSQLSFGLQKAVRAACAVADDRAVACSTRSDDVALAFDKSRAQACFMANGVPVPAALGPVEDFAALQAAMDRTRTDRVFVKLRHGAAAAGMIALARRGSDWRAVTSADIGGDGVLRATRRLRTITSQGAIAHLVDQMAPLGLHVETWVPKIGIEGHVADLRLVTLCAKVSAATVRTSRHPITNLHLGGQRLPASSMIAAVGKDMWENIRATARQVAGLFPRSETLGIDIAVSADGQRHYVLEANIFGDFVKDADSDTSHSHHLAMHRIATRSPIRRAA